jgi:hypothetical protein
MSTDTCYVEYHFAVLFLTSLPSAYGFFIHNELIIIYVLLRRQQFKRNPVALVSVVTCFFCITMPSLKKYTQSMDQVEPLVPLPLNCLLDMLTKIGTDYVPNVFK